MSQDLNTTNIVIPYGAGTSAAGTNNYLLMPVPGTAYGGGINLVRGYYSSSKAIAAGSAPAFNLITLNATGGTIGTIGANGSAALSAGTPVVATISTKWVPGTISFLAIQLCHDDIVAQNTALTASFQWYAGRGSA